MKRWALLLAILLPATPSPASERGEQLFEANCASAGCHGPKGIGGQGPTLQGRGLSASQITDVVTLGRPGTAMAPFKDVLGEENLKRVVAYVQALSEAPAPSSAKLTVEDATVANGRILFFDTRRLAWCSACHSAGGRGGPVGADLAGAVLPPGGLVAFNGSSRSEAFQGIAVTLTDGQEFTGLAREAGDGVLKLLDLSSVPPVTRTFESAQIARSEPLKRPAFDHRILPYTVSDLAAIAAFLRVSESGK